MATGTSNFDIQGHLGDKTLLDKSLLFVTGNDNELERHAVVYLPSNIVFWDLCGHDVRCPQLSALKNGQIRQP